MQYKGRIISLLVCIMGGLSFRFLGYLEQAKHIRVGNYQIILTSIMIVLFWMVGRRYDKIMQSHLIDSLTEVYNRNYIKLFSRSIFEKAKKRNENMCIMVIDIDKFKYINDTYGHLKGDNILKSTAQTLKLAVRGTDTVVRWGGDEFLIFLYDIEFISLEHCPMQDRIENMLNELSNRSDIELSFSMGRALFAVDGDNLDTLIEVADSRMYKIKKGKDEIVKEDN